MEHWIAYIISVVMGLLVGIERERAHPHQKALGIRTFLLVAILGVLAGDDQPQWISFLITLFVFSLIGISYFSGLKLSKHQNDRGLTTEFAAGIIFCLSYLSHTHQTLVAVLGPLVALILFSKVKLHEFSYHIKTNELEAALLLILAAVTTISLVPDKAIDPWGIFNLQKFGILVLILGGLEFLSYLLIKILGEKKGTLLIGFLGGLVSSTAVLLSSAKKANSDPQRWSTALVSTLASKAAAAIELLFIVGFISSPLLLKVLPFMMTAILICLAALGLTLKFSRPDLQANGFELKSPLDWKGVLRLSILLASILALISAAKIWFGDQASFLISFMTGLFELHGVSLANATMFAQENISREAASLNILLAFNASLVSKMFMSWTLCKNKFSSYTSIIFFLMMLVSILTWWLINS